MLFFIFLLGVQKISALKLFIVIFVQLFQRIRNPHQIIRFLIPKLNFYENFEAKCSRNGSKTKKTLFKNVLDHTFHPSQKIVYDGEMTMQHEANIRGGGKAAKVVFKYLSRARICNPFQDPRNRFPAWRNRFRGIDSWPA